MTSAEFTPHGFKIPRPVGLPASEKVWEAAETFGAESQAVSRALFHAVMEIERVVRSQP